MDMRKIIILCLALTVGVISFVNAQDNKEEKKWDEIDLDSSEVEQLDSTEIINVVNNVLTLKNPSFDWFRRATWILYNVKSEKVRECYVMWAIQKELAQHGYGFGTVNDVLEDIRLCSKSMKLSNQAKVLVDRYCRIRGGRKVEAPAFELKSLQGEDVRLVDLKGKFVFMFVWDGENAMEELSIMKAIGAKYKDSTNVCCLTVAVLPINKTEAWENFVQREKIGNHLKCLHTEKNSSFIQDYCITELPRCVLIDQDGKIVNAWGISPKEDGLMFYLDRVINRLESEPVSINDYR